jgi:signal transduction histidine kinase
MSPGGFTLEDLRRIDLFDDLDDDQLAEWLPVTEREEFEGGEVMAEQGQENTPMRLLLDGTAQAYLVDGEQSEPLGLHRAPTWMGAITALTDVPLGVRMLAESHCVTASIDPAEFRRLTLSQPAVHMRVMKQVAPVMNHVQGTEQNRERLAALGTMAAGLAHELNNPAAAAQRAAAQLAEAIEVVGSTMDRFVQAGVTREEAEKLLALHHKALDQARSCTVLDALDAADAEDDLLAAMEDLDVAEPWKLTEPLALARVDEDWLQQVHELAGDATDAALQWTAASVTANGLAEELQESTKRMSGLVGAVKSYAYMDRGDVVEVDLHEGLETTITVLGHKLKHTSIDVVRDYDREIPKLTIRGGELNQVWTNLIDNAIQALGENGTITVTTRRDNDCATVDITDDGPGIPAEIQDRVFESFFTTKDVGQGTGLGLATARSIVVDRHGGSMSLDSEPGRTTFHVRLPLRNSKG